MEEDFSDSDTEFDYTSDDTWSPLHESPNTSYNEDSDDFIQEDEDEDEDLLESNQVLETIPEEQVVPQINMEQFQENVNKEFKINYNDIDFELKALPFTFHNNFDKLGYKNNGNKVILPKRILYELSNYENVAFPITLKINDNYLGVLEFNEFIEEIFIPNHVFYNLELQENELIKFSVLHKPLQKATYLKIKPLDDSFYYIENKKTYLETHIRNLYSVLTEEQTINLIYGQNIIPFYIMECKPDKNVSMDEIEELEVNIEPINEPKPIEAEPPVEPCAQESTQEVEADIDEELPGFVPFGGKGHSLK